MTTATVRYALAQYKRDVRSRIRPVRHRAGQRFVERIYGRYSVPVDPDNAPAVAEHLERIARAEGMPIPPGFRFVSILQGKADVTLKGNNVRDAIDQLRGILNRRVVAA